MSSARKKTLKRKVVSPVKRLSGKISDLRQFVKVRGKILRRSPNARVHRTPTPTNTPAYNTPNSSYEGISYVLHQHRLDRLLRYVRDHRGMYSGPDRWGPHDYVGYYYISRYFHKTCVVNSEVSMTLRESRKGPEVATLTVTSMYDNARTAAEDKPSCRFVVCPLNLFLNDVHGNGRAGHANVVVYDRKARTVTHFEPNGYYVPHVDLSVVFAPEGSGYTFVPHTAVFPGVPGIQVVEHTSKRYRNRDGYCEVHCLLYVLLRLLYPDEPYKVREFLGVHPDYIRTILQRLLGHFSRFEERYRDACSRFRMQLSDYELQSKEYEFPEGASKHMLRQLSGQK